MTASFRAGTLGRDRGPGTDYIAVVQTGSGRWEVRRMRRLNWSNDARRRLDIHDMPAEPMVIDLLSIIERIMERDYVDLDSRGLTGDLATIRERLLFLANFGDSK